ncbi:hypothetical protein QAD02_020126 [Eretmocerus hayati]|uniref:Uncharacterized protein n=1 Tax=Eretmocerus hayati TaxID=131215 RepID=A0ACC2PP21_9HYME|nr:hypothetical protein QAD02_020126 [Eretmocerus hayati]
MVMLTGALDHFIVNQHARGRKPWEQIQGSSIRFLMISDPEIPGFCNCLLSSLLYEKLAIPPASAVANEHAVFGPFKFIKIPSVRGERFLPEVLRSNKSRMAETMFFIREAAEDLFTRRALMISVDQPSGARGFSNGLMILDDDELQKMRKSRTFDVSGQHNRLFKKKKAIILPVLILLNLLKVKLMLIPIFLGVHFIKKLLVLGSLLLPSVLSHLKICKMAHNSYYHHHPWAPPEYTADYPGAYGHEDSWDHRNDVSAGPYSNYYYGHGLYNPFSYYFQNYNKQQ